MIERHGIEGKIELETQYLNSFSEILRRVQNFESFVAQRKSRDRQQNLCFICGSFLFE